MGSVAEQIRARSSALDALASGIRSSVPTVAPYGQTWVLGGDGGTRTLVDSKGFPISVLHVAILDASPYVSRSFYRAVYDPKAPSTAPDCASADGVTPDLDIPSPEAENCNDCWANRWGSLAQLRGGGGSADLSGNAKACSSYKALLVLLLQDIAPAVNAGKLPTPRLLRVKATSFKSLSELVQQVKRTGLALEEQHVTISFQPGVTYPQLNFQVARTLPEKALEVIARVIESGAGSEYLPGAVPKTGPGALNSPGKRPQQALVSQAGVPAPSASFQPQPQPQPPPRPMPPPRPQPRPQPEPEPWVAEEKDAGGDDLYGLLDDDSSGPASNGLDDPLAGLEQEDDSTEPVMPEVKPAAPQPAPAVLNANTQPTVKRGRGRPRKNPLPSEPAVRPEVRPEPAPQPAMAVSAGEETAFEEAQMTESDEGDQETNEYDDLLNDLKDIGL